MKGKYRRLMMGVSGYSMAVSILIFALVNSANVVASQSRSKNKIAKAAIKTPSVANKKSDHKKIRAAPPKEAARVTRTELKNTSGRRVVHISFKTKSAPKPAEKTENQTPIFDSTTNHPGGMDVALLPREK